MKIKQLSIKNFRCFTNYQLDISSNVLIIEGLNGSGKTSILEALHYGCYLRSFRTYSPAELAKDQEREFYIKIGVDQPEGLFSHELQVGYSAKKRLVKIDQKQITSYKELLDYYQVVTLTESDLSLIQFGPEVRRNFIDQIIMMYDPEYIGMIKKLRHIVDNRNALLKRHTLDKESYILWSDQLWELSIRIRDHRKQSLADLKRRVDTLVEQYFSNLVVIDWTYDTKGPEFDSFEHYLLPVCSINC